MEISKDTLKALVDAPIIQVIEILAARLVEENGFTVDDYINDAIEEIELNKRNA